MLRVYVMIGICPEHGEVTGVLDKAEDIYKCPQCGSDLKWKRDSIPDLIEKVGEIRETGIVLLPPMDREKVMDFFRAIKEKLNGVKVIGFWKYLSNPGPPGFDYIYATHTGWIAKWKVYEGEDIEAYKRKQPTTYGQALNEGAIDLRNI